MEELCASIAVEKDHGKFLELVKQLNRVLEESHLHLGADGNQTATKLR